MRKKLILNIKKLECKRTSRIIFKPISFKINEGSLTLVKGRNGIGKTTLLHCIAGLIPFKGEINWNIDLKFIGYVGHKIGMKEYETVNDFIIFWKNIYNSKINIKNIIDLFSLQKVIYTPLGLLSFGQKKKLSFVRLYLCRTKLWLLDEPFSGMDKKNKEIISKIIEEHLACKGAIILSSHEQIKILDKYNKKELIIV